MYLGPPEPCGNGKRWNREILGFRRSFGLPRSAMRHFRLLWPLVSADQPNEKNTTLTHTRADGKTTYCKMKSYLLPFGLWKQAGGLQAVRPLPRERGCGPSASHPLFLYLKQLQTQMKHIWEIIDFTTAHQPRAHVTGMVESPGEAKTATCWRSLEEKKFLVHIAVQRRWRWR